MTQPTMCMGMPAGYESPCGIYPDAHGPHPLDQPMTRRAQAIASIHALADYLAEHPEHPTPENIVLQESVTEVQELDEIMRAHMIKSWAAANGGTIWQAADGGPVLVGHVVLMDAEGFGVHVVYDRYAHGMTVRHTEG